MSHEALSREAQVELAKMVIAGYIIAARDGQQQGKPYREEDAGEFARGVFLGMNQDFQKEGYALATLDELWPLPEAYVTVARHIIATGKLPSYGARSIVS